MQVRIGVQRFAAVRAGIIYIERHDGIAKRAFIDGFAFKRNVHHDAPGNSENNAHPPHHPCIFIPLRSKDEDGQQGEQGDGACDQGSFAGSVSSIGLAAAPAAFPPGMPAGWQQWNSVKVPAFKGTPQLHHAFIPALVAKILFQTDLPLAKMIYAMDKIHIGNTGKKMPDLSRPCWPGVPASASRNEARDETPFRPSTEPLHF